MAHRQQFGRHSARCCMCCRSCRRPRCRRSYRRCRADHGGWWTQEGVSMSDREQPGGEKSGQDAGKEPSVFEEGS